MKELRKAVTASTVILGLALGFLAATVAVRFPRYPLHIFLIIPSMLYIFLSVNSFLDLFTVSYVSAFLGHYTGSLIGIHCKVAAGEFTLLDLSNAMVAFGLSLTSLTVAMAFISKWVVLYNPPFGVVPSKEACNSSGRRGLLMLVPGGILGLLSTLMPINIKLFIFALIFSSLSSISFYTSLVFYSFITELVKLTLCRGGDATSLMLGAELGAIFSIVVYSTKAKLGVKRPTLMAGIAISTFATMAGLLISVQANAPYLAGIMMLQTAVLSLEVACIEGSFFTGYRSDIKGPYPLSSFMTPILLSFTAAFLSKIPDPLVKISSLITLPLWGCIIGCIYLRSRSGLILLVSPLCLLVSLFLPYPIITQASSASYVPYVPVKPTHVLISFILWFLLGLLHLLVIAPMIPASPFDPVTALIVLTLNLSPLESILLTLPLLAKIPFVLLKRELLSFKKTCRCTLSVYSLILALSLMTRL